VAPVVLITTAVAAALADLQPIMAALRLQSRQHQEHTQWLLGREEQVVILHQQAEVHLHLLAQVYPYLLQAVVEEVQLFLVIPARLQAALAAVAGHKVGLMAQQELPGKVLLVEMVALLQDTAVVAAALVA
jgi:hypothetical protein